MLNFGTDDQEEVESNEIPPEILEDVDDEDTEELPDDEIAEDDEVIEKDSL